ncbi:ribokinase [Fodinicola acaciae]|uniref:ribokinase n=1 Tax=Fodinicola acaciae TaxID=2681555 RepID=UPI0013D09A6E|nr:ribokinase [Fodinicola acaciae]
MPDQVVVIGSVNVDHAVRADFFPAPGETIAGREVRTGLGGKGANQAVAARLAGAAVRMVGRVGADSDGEKAKQRLADRGVDVAGVGTVTDVPTGSAWITVTPDDNSIIVVPGANAHWDDGQSLSSDGVTLCQLEIPLAVVERAASECTGTFVLNAAPAQPLPDSLLAQCDVLVVNEHELGVVGPGFDVRAAHAALLDRGVGAVITTIGAAGAVLTDAGETLELPAIPADVVDTTGAGDAFVGVLAARLTAGDSLREAVRWGMAAGSLAVRRAGAQESFPTAMDIRQLLGS